MVDPVAEFYVFHRVSPAKSELTSSCFDIAGFLSFVVGFSSKLVSASVSKRAAT